MVCDRALYLLGRRLGISSFSTLVLVDHEYWPWIRKRRMVRQCVNVSFIAAIILSMRRSVAANFLNSDQTIEPLRSTTVPETADHA